MALLAVIVSLLLLFSSLLFWKASARPEATINVREKINYAKSIMDFTIFGDEASSNLRSRLAIRANPNKRLSECFGLTNSFTTFDVEVHRSFLTLAITTIKQAMQTGLQQARQRAVMVVEHEQLWAGKKEFSLQSLVRVMTLAAVIRMLYPDTNDGELDITALLAVGDSINCLWIQSKGESVDDMFPSGTEALAHLKENLGKLVPITEQNPLALIIPAYETLWRVVLLTYVHLVSRAVDHSTESQVYLMADRLMSEDGIRYEDVFDRVSKEALRLYPPTKRIYRAADGIELSANIEALHHDKEIWGSDSLEFNPSRFLNISPEAQDAFMPFGSGRHTCPAARGFGYQIIAVMLSVLITKIGTAQDGTKIEFHDEELDNDETAPLPTGRDSMKKWTVTSALRR